MNYIYRESLDILLDKVRTKHPYAAIISGIVGCGKTTLVEQLLHLLSDEFEIFRFTGDDILFRRNVSEDSKWILKHIQSNTGRKSLVFVDEVQKDGLIKR
jgi:predicted AAA+ superfamily ATPase